MVFGHGKNTEFRMRARSPGLGSAARRYGHELGWAVQRNSGGGSKDTDTDGHSVARASWFPSAFLGLIVFFFVFAHNRIPRMEGREFRAMGNYGVTGMGIWRG